MPIICAGENFSEQKTRDDNKNANEATEQEKEKSVACELFTEKLFLSRKVIDFRTPTVTLLISWHFKYFGVARLRDTHTRKSFDYYQENHTLHVVIKQKIKVCQKNERS